MQFLFQGASQGERGLYVTLDEKPEQIKQNLSAFGWDIDKQEREGRLIFIDATPLRRVRAPTDKDYGIDAESAITITVPELTLPTLMRTIRKVSEEEDISRIGVDPITSLMVRYYEIAKRRRAMLLFFDALYSTGCTCVITSELRTSMLERHFQLEEFLSQGAILLRTHIHEGNVVHAIQVEKMRGIAHDTQLRPYQIGAKGIEVFPKDKVFT